MEIDLTKCSVVELKALVYDQMASKEVAERNIEVINNELRKRLTTPPAQPEDTVEEKGKTDETPTSPDKSPDPAPAN